MNSLYMLLFSVFSCITMIAMDDEENRHRLLTVPHHYVLPLDIRTQRHLNRLSTEQLYTGLALQKSLSNINNYEPVLKDCLITIARQRGDFVVANLMTPARQQSAIRNLAGRHATAQQKCINIRLVDAIEQGKNAQFISQKSPGISLSHAYLLNKDQTGTCVYICNNKQREGSSDVVTVYTPTYNSIVRLPQLTKNGFDEDRVRVARTPGEQAKYLALYTATHALFGGVVGGTVGGLVPASVRKAQKAAGKAAFEGFTNGVVQSIYNNAAAKEAIDTGCAGALENISTVDGMNLPSRAPQAGTAATGLAVVAATGFAKNYIPYVADKVYQAGVDQAMQKAGNAAVTTLLTVPTEFDIQDAKKGAAIGGIAGAAYGFAYGLWNMRTPIHETTIKDSGRLN
jgi:hypothetical protein